MDENEKTQDETKDDKAQVWTEAPYSANVRARIGKYDWQLTIRSGDSAEFIKKVLGMNKWLDSMNANGNGFHKETQEPQPQQVATTAVPQPQVPPPPPTSQTQSNEPLTAQCQMIEVGTSYTGNKIQLKFHCNGLDNPLTYTKSTDEMAKLLAPIGFTPAHIVNGQKYPVPCVVTYHLSTKDGKTYKNVDSVTR